MKRLLIYSFVFLISVQLNAIAEDPAIAPCSAPKQLSVDAETPSQSSPQTQQGTAEADLVEATREPASAPEPATTDKELQRELSLLDIKMDESKARGDRGDALSNRSQRVSPSFAQDPSSKDTKKGTDTNY